MYLLITRWSDIPETLKESKAYSGDFWLFIGILTLILMSFQVILPTSIPVYNAIVELFGGFSNLAPPAEKEIFYSNAQIWFASSLAIFSSIALDQLLKENKNYLDELENEYRSKLKEEHEKISDLKKSVDEILKIKDLELRIVDKKIDEINKNLKNLSSDEFIKNFKKELKRQLDDFKNSTIESFEEQLNISVDTTKIG